MTKPHMLKPIALFAFLLLSSLFIFASAESNNEEVVQQHSQLRRGGTRNLKGSKSSKSRKGTNSSKSSKSSKSTKSKKSANDNTQTTTLAPTISPTQSPTSFSCVNKVDTYKSDGSPLDDIIEALVESQDFSSYCQSNFDAAREWFLDAANHPIDLPQDGENYKNYMTERLILTLTYSANCKDGCTLITAPTYDLPWLSTIDHCKWEGIYCNESMEINMIFLWDGSNGYGLSGEFTFFGMKSLEFFDVYDNNLSGTFNVAGASGNLKFLWLHANKFTNYMGGGILTNLEFLELSENEFEGDFIITKENFPASLKELDLSSNNLTSVDAESGAVSALSKLNISKIDSITVKDELCSRRPELSITPLDSCNT